MPRPAALALVLVVVTSATCFFSLPLADNDLWGHVFFGRQVLARGAPPPTNEFSYTAPRFPWINHEILAECAFAWVFDHLGSPGLLALKLWAGLATIGAMARTVRRRTRDSLAAALALILAASLMSFGYLVRPQIFSFLALAVVWDRLHRYDEGARSSLWILPPIFALWIDTHGGVMAGLGVFLVFVAVRLPRADPVERRDLLVVGAASLAALCLNPYGIALPAFLVRDLARDRPMITEWAPIPLFGTSNAQFKLALLLLVAGFFLLPARRAWEWAIVALAAVGTFRHQRHLPLFAILSTPLFAVTFAAIGGSIVRRTAPLAPSPAGLALFVLGCLAIALVQLGFVVRFARELHLQIFVSPDEFPVDAVRMIRANHLRGNLAVPFGWGEYALWHLFPDCRVSIDGRYTTAYPDDVIERSWRFSDGGPGWERALDGAAIVLADRRQRTAERLFHEPGWRYVYSDQTALVFVRDDVRLPDPVVRHWRTTEEGAFFFP